MNQTRIEVIPYNTAWPAQFQSEATRLQASGLPITAIHHIGSTAIPNMPAKPVIDILLELSSIDQMHDIEDKLIQLGYSPLRRSFIPHMSYFTMRQDGMMRFHVHINLIGDPQIYRHINFRDFMTAHPDAARAYADLKSRLANEFSNDRFRYTFGKDKLVQQIDTMAKRWSRRLQNDLIRYRGPQAQEWSQEKIIKTMEANLNVHMTYFAQYLNHVELIRIPGYTLVNSGLADDTFNYVLDANFTHENVSEKITEVTDYFRQHAMPFSWWLSPHDQPADLTSHLERAGFINTENHAGMYLNLDNWKNDKPALADLRIVRACDHSSLHDFFLLQANHPAAYEQYATWIMEVISDDDPEEFYVGYIGDTPVIRALTCYYGGIAGLYWLSTSSDATRKGYDNAMLQFHLREAKSRGYHIAALQASAEGLPLYRQIGYKECGVFREFKLKV